MLKRSHMGREIVEILVLTILIFIGVRFVVQSYHVQGDSMNPGLVTDEYVMVNKISYLFHNPERGDVIVFHYPHDVTQNYIKRVIGLPGDHIVVDSTNIWVNGQKLNESTYISKAYNSGGNSWVVPTNDYFVLGDNRPVSDDSRDWGFVPRSYIIGKAALVFWPLPQTHFINTYASVYANIPGTK